MQTMHGFGQLRSFLWAFAFTSTPDRLVFPPFFFSNSTSRVLHARVSLALCKSVQTSSPILLPPAPSPSSIPFTFSLRLRFVAFGTAVKPMTRHRQLHSRKSARQFVTRNSSVWISTFLIASPRRPRHLSPLTRSLSLAHDFHTENEGL